MIAENPTNHDLSMMAAEIARRLDDTQRAENYLSALLENWGEYTDEERREEVAVALDRLTRCAT